jgi:aryl-alcohol dehydrogenase-like predicted oxidoreductase
MTGRRQRPRSRVLYLERPRANTRSVTVTNKSLKQLKLYRRCRPSRHEPGTLAVSWVLSNTAITAPIVA